MAKKQFYDYEGEAIRVRYEPRRCIHAEKCVHGLPGVFDRYRRPWIDADLAGADEVAATVESCPTGALYFERRDGGAAEVPPDANVATLVADGPLYLRGRLRLRLPSGETREETRVALCRCGHSRYKPFCDDSHREAAFEDDGRLNAAMLGPGDAVEGDAPLEISMAPNGPVVLRGPVEIRSADGSEAQSGTRGALCRCGASSSRPYCDGSHASAGFEAE